MRDFQYSSTLGSFNCFKAAEFYLNRTETEKGPALIRGIERHKDIEAYLKKERDWPLHIPRDLKDELDKHTFIFIEQPLIYQSGDFAYKGVIDGYTLEGVVIDWKFPNEPWNKEKAQKYIEDQGVLYPWVISQYGLCFSKMQFLVCPENGPFQVWDVPFTEEERLRILGRHKVRYSQLRNAASNNNFTASPSQWNCRFCNYRKVCEDRI